MMLNLGPRAQKQESEWLKLSMWILPAILALVLACELLYVLALGPGGWSMAEEVGPKQVSISLFGPYILGVELASLLLLAGLVGAYHLGRLIRTPGKEIGEGS
jgi:NADH-quinone oxidoreductase subunit J